VRERSVLDWLRMWFVMTMADLFHKNRTFIGQLNKFPLTNKESVPFSWLVGWLVG